jgi:hypothetical protein
MVQILLQFLYVLIFIFFRPTLRLVLEHHFFAAIEKIPKMMPSALAYAEPTWRNGVDGSYIPTFESSEPTVGTIRKTFDSALQALTQGERKRSPLTEQGTDLELRKSAMVTSKPTPTMNYNRIPESLGKNGKAFQIYDEYREHESDSPKPKAQVIVTSANALDEIYVRGEIPGSIDSIIKQTATLSIGNCMNGRLDIGNKNASPSAEKHKLPPIPTADNLALELMHSRLCYFFERGSKKEDSHCCKKIGNNDVNVWVVRYVDYTSKYGFGFLLNNGSAGVYFNDSTKAVVAPDRETFQYIERRKHSSGFSDCEIHTLTSFPDSLKKKVTLLKHFCSYLLEQQKRSVEVEMRNDLEVSDTSSVELVYLTKWVRTKHAIFFRLSDGTVQIVFFDQTELMLSSDISSLVYVDKTQSRTSMTLDLHLIESHPDVAKRLKYGKDILHQLVQAGKG